MKILVINSGSSTIKYRIFQAGTLVELAAGAVEEIGEPVGRLWRRGPGATGARKLPIPDHRAGYSLIMAALAESGIMVDESRFLGIGHRVVHGGEHFREPVLIDGRVVEAIRSLIALAPLHNPGNLMGIEAALARFPGVPQVAVFDTSFHQTLPPHAFHYALPPEWYERHRVRRYGFHGMNHQHVAEEAAARLGRPLQSLNLITLHLGNGASATAIREGRSVDTSMGLTPLEGLIMGTRSGDLDPAILFYLRREKGILVDELEALLNHGSGLKGICGTNDMKEVLERAAGGDERARLALDMYCYRVRKYIGAYYAVLGRVDALVFTGGVGENASLVRSLSCRGLERLGIAVDEARNAAPAEGIREIQRDGADVRVLVIPSGEEVEIARRTQELGGHHT